MRSQKSLILKVLCFVEGSSRANHSKSLIKEHVRASVYKFMSKFKFIPKQQAGTISSTGILNYGKFLN